MTIREKSIYSRHSTRYFDSNHTINKEDQERILQAGLRAPSPKNRQPWELVVIDGKDTIKRLSSVMEDQVRSLKNARDQMKRDTSDLDMAISTANIIRSASMVVLVCYERDESNEHGELMDWPITAQAFEVADIQAIGACIENMLLTAEEMSIASLWICDVLYAEKELSDAFGLMSPLVAAVAFGKAAPYQSPRQSLSEKVRWVME